MGREKNNDILAAIQLPKDLPCLTADVNYSYSIHHIVKHVEKEIHSL